MVKKYPLANLIEKSCLALAAAGSSLTIQSALAQTESTAKPVLETIVVTAERREANIQDVPISITMIGGEYLDAIAVGGGDVRMLANKAPSLNIESSNGRTFPRFYIRGYGNTDFSSFASQPVSLVYDDVVLENPALKGFPAFDLAGIEVLRGPQGTLFGRNTPAGVVKFNSAKPVIGSTEGYVNLSLATYMTSNVEGAFNMPINDEWAARFSLLYNHRDDWVDNDYINPAGESISESDALGGYDDSAGRLQVLYEPTDGSMTALFNLHARNIDNGTARLFRANLIDKGTNSTTADYDPDQMYVDAENTQSYTSVGGNARISWDLDQYTLHSITGYESVTHYFTRGDIDGGYGAAFAGYSGPDYIPFPVETAGGLDDHEQISQELRIESDYAGALNWQAGVFYFYEDVTDDSFTYDTLGGTPATWQQSRQENTAWAVFGSATYDVSDRLQVSAGIRYTHDDKDFELPVASSDPAAITYTQSETASKVTWDASAHYALTDATALYARVATGFRAPSFGSLSATDQEITVADSETIISYETGIKTDFWDNRARLNFNIYYYEVSDQQLTAVGGTANETALINADKTIGKGAEFDFEALLTDNLKVTVGGSYNDTEIDDDSLAVAGCGTDSDGSQLCTITDPQLASGLYSIDGNSLPQAAEWIGNATLRYGYPLADGSEMYFYSDIAYTSEVSFFLYDSKEFTSQGLLETGMRLGYSWDGGQYDAALFCRNCSNTTRVTGAIDFDNRTGFINDPRIVGVQFKASF